MTSNDNNNTRFSPFSLIADIDGDVRELYNQQHEGSLPILPLRGMVLFPGVVAPIAVGRDSSKAIIQWAVERGLEKSFIAVAAQVDPRIEEPTIEDLFPIATLARIMKVIESPDGQMHVILQAYGRIEMEQTTTRTRPFMRTYATHLDEILPDPTAHTWNVLFDTLRDETMKYLEAHEYVSPEAIVAIRGIHNPFYFINYVATNLPIDIEDKLFLLQESDVAERTMQLLHLVERELRYIELRKTIEERTRDELNSQQREMYLQTQLRNIQNELSGGTNPDSARLTKSADERPMPKGVRETFDRELQKMERLNPASPDYNLILTYLETLVALPWEKVTTDDMDISKARRILNRDHYGMEKVKERILEHLAMMRYSSTHKAPILCLYGPPGVGKTSLGRSIAESLGRKYVRMSLGGLHDESEIRGHRRTYIGAMCGRVMKNIIKSETMNPVFVLDEIDKVSGNNHNGDPQSALLELLDPEQNTAFHDNYLDIDFDLSNVFFIATANNIGDIPPALRDRMEMIEVEGYLTEEKLEIAKHHLLPRTQKTLTLPYSIKLSKGAFEFLIERYTRESGVRQLQKLIDKVVRRVVIEAAECANDSLPHSTLKPADIERLIGMPRFSRDSYQGNRSAGVVTGLAWTAVGGDILFIETSLSRSKAPRLTTTGNLGDVMKESAALAIEYVKAHADHLGLDYRIFEQWSIHIHVPEGATPKDGPSAGITIATSIASALTGRRVRDRIAMTGEITLRGKVLPVGGIKEKILAAKRAGITDIMLSSENRKDINDIPAKYVKGLTFHFVNTVAEVWDFALLDDLAPDHIHITLEDQPKHDQ